MSKAKAKQETKATAEQTIEEQARQTLLHRAKTYKAEFENAKAEFLHNVEVDPKQAIGWSKTIVQAQVRYEDCGLPIEKRLAEDDGEPITELLEKHLKKLRKKIGWTLGGGSTSPFDRAIDRIKGEALHFEATWIEDILDWVERANRKEA